MLAHRRRMSKSVLLPRIAVANSALLATSSVNGLNYGRVSHNHLFHHRRPLANAPEDVPDSTWAYGYALLAGTAIMFLATMYAIVGSKFAPDTQIKVGGVSTARSCEQAKAK